MGAKNTKGQTLDQIIENQNGESKLHTGFILNASNYVVEYYIEKAYYQHRSSKPPTVYTQQQHSQHQRSQHEQSEEWDDWKDWQNSQTSPSKRQPDKSVKSSTKKSQSQPQQQQQEDAVEYRYALVSIPRGKLQIKGLDGILLGRSYLSICLRKQTEYCYFKKRERIEHFSDVFLVVTNDGCEKMQKSLINQYIRQVLPEFSPIKKIDQDELTQSNRSARQNHSQTGSKLSQRRLF